MKLGRGITCQGSTEDILSSTIHAAGCLALLILLVQLPFNHRMGDWSGPPDAGAAQLSGAAAPQGEGEDAGSYHTPLAGEARRTQFLGYPVDIPALDRGHMTSITVGGSILQPKQGDTPGVPFVALWLRRVWEDSRTRDVVSLFENDLEYDRSFGHLEMVGRFENDTLPFGRTELVHNREIDATSVAYGTLLGSLGPGLRFPMAPYQVDNDLRIQLLGRAGFFYAARTDETSGQVLPPDTLLYGAKLRLRYDGMRRNLLELPHRGFATGFDVDYLCRDSWRDLGTPENAQSSGNRDYFQASGYFVGAGGIPGLSERNRVLASLYGGSIVHNRGDRFNAFHLNGGPFPSEADDLPRVHYTGLVYDDILTTRYATASLGYRRELTFFLYLTLVGSYIWADRATALASNQVVFKTTSAVSSTVSLDSAFFWNSELYLGYVRDSGVIRGGKAGNGLLLTWSKLF